MGILDDLSEVTSDVTGAVVDTAQAGYNFATGDVEGGKRELGSAGDHLVDAADHGPLPLLLLFHPTTMPFMVANMSLPWLWDKLFGDEPKGKFVAPQVPETDLYDKRDHFHVITLASPEKAPNTLRGYIEFTEDAMQRLVDLLGSGTSTPPPDVDALLREAGLMSKEGTSMALDRYDEHHESVRAVQGVLQTDDIDVHGATGKALEIAEAAWKDIDRVANLELNEYLKAVTDVKAVDVLLELAAALHRVRDLVKDASDKIGDLSEGVDEPTPASSAPAPEPVAPAVTPSTPTIPAAVEAPAAVSPAASDDSSLYGDLLGAPKTPASDSAATATPTSTPVAPPTSTSASIPAVASAPAPTSSASGMDQLGMMMPMMMMAMQPMLAGLMGKKKDDSKEEDEQDPTPAPKPAAEPGPPATPTVTAPAADPPPPVSAVPSAMVDVHLPGGGSQKVPAAAAQALNKELHNPNGCDARAAYVGTVGQSTPGHQWVTVDGTALRTGDVVQWENRTALVVVTEGGLHYVTDGRLTALDPQNPHPDDHGSYGAFQGFFHPTGLDALAVSS